MTASPIAYPTSVDGRDLRIDLLRGLIMVYLIVVHFELASALSIFAWDRLALISSAEGFVFLSGIVVGLVYRRRMERDGLREATRLLWRRAWQLYQVNLFVIASIALLGLIPAVDVFELTHWTNPWSGESFPLYPAAGTAWWDYLVRIALLRIGPHQFQVIGLYVLLMACAPLALYLAGRRLTWVVLLLSWGAYALNHYLQLRVTGARYEYAFPSLTWQLLFFHGLLIGYYRDRTLEFLASTASRWLVYLCVALLAGFFFLANNNPHPLFWPWGHLSFIAPETFGEMYRTWFMKTPLGLGRLLNNVAAFVVAYHLLSRYWRYFERPLGWLLIPLGQNSLYVFILHIYVLLILYNTPLPDMDLFSVNTLIHLGVIVSIWLMVKQRFLFSVVPR
ncbi:OpgC domain-containing protein [Thiorhodococcus minor]|uniref:Succinyl transferase OpgC n=1 Tax=Thiorhodococcus minor TaxID=57489 RepID=A0A6M0K4X2_9GAMM|nr:OpgC domain-containing protein [Thiorhodococcus minor]NEV64314.1 succinyl transferase OpgC [Thiorhodococcus minor]